MDWKSLGAVYAILVTVGVVISLLSTQLQCSKTSFSVAILEGAKFGILPFCLYGLTYFEAVRKPFITFFIARGLDSQTAEMIGIGYLIMLGAWVSGVWNVHNSEIATCVASTSEMTEFKDKLMKELAEKQAAEEANATAKPSK
jgi:hypothetical protein